MEHVHIVKRRKDHTEPYDNHKVYASCYMACLSVHIPKEEAEVISEKVMKKIDTWIKEKDDVTSEQIFQQIARELKLHSEDAAFIYESHRDVN